MVQPLNLSNTTLWGCCWSMDKIMLERTVRVMMYCVRHIKFGRIVLFSHIQPEGFPFETIQVPRLATMKQWDHFILRWIPRHLTTTAFALQVHEDGFPINFKLWKPEFQNYDWIGAPWDDGVVGNGGFVMESQTMLRLKPYLPFDDPEETYASDYMVCRRHRDQLVKSGIRFAPTTLAAEFATEMVGNEFPSFGFHGRNWAKQKYEEGWRLIQKDEEAIK